MIETTSQSPRLPLIPQDIDPKYADLVNHKLAAVLTSEDQQEEVHDLSPHDRLTCRTHRRWVHECLSSPLHVIIVTGHRWCRDCQTAAEVAVDELTASMAMRCPRCGRMPDGWANRRTAAACRTSIVMAQITDSRSISLRSIRTFDQNGHQ